MGKNAIFFIVLGCFFPVVILYALYLASGSPIYNDADWLWITQMYAMVFGLIAVLSLGFYYLGRRR